MVSKTGAAAVGVIIAAVAGTGLLLVAKARPTLALKFPGTVQEGTSAPWSGSNMDPGLPYTVATGFYQASGVADDFGNASGVIPIPTGLDKTQRYEIILQENDSGAFTAAYFFVQ